MTGSKITVSNEELISVRDAMRAMNVLVSGLEDHSADKFVLTKGSKMVAVIISMDTYSQLLQRTQLG